MKLYKDNEGKTCTKCNTYKKLEEFNINKKSKDGRKTECKYCAIKRERARYHSNSAAHMESVIAWQKKNPQKVKDIQKKYRDNKIRPE